MARSQNAFIKKKKAEAKRKKKKEKFERKLEKKDLPKKGGLEDMMAYVDEFGNITSEPPVVQPKKAEPKSKDKEKGEETSKENA